MTLARPAASKLPSLGPGGFRFVTKAIAVDGQSGDDGKRRFHTIASSTIKDLGKDEMKITALEDMADAFKRGVNIFMNHSYKVPDDVFGRSDWAEIRDSGIKSKTGATIWDLHIGGVVNDPNPIAKQLADSMEGGYVVFGTSVGAIVKEHQRNKDGGMDIAHVDLKEGSIVGIPMNQRSWTQKAAKAAEDLDEVGSGLPEDDEDEPETIAVEAEKSVTEVPVEEVEKAELSSHARSEMDSSEFACPEKRKYPINDAAHVRNALARIANPDNDQCGREKILAAARRMGIGDHGKAWTDDELLTWAAMCESCGHSAANDDCGCTGSAHHSGNDHDEDDYKSADEVIEAEAITKASTEGGQEAEPAATPETTPEPEAAQTDPATDGEQKVASAESADVVELVTKAVRMAGMIADRDERIAALNDQIATLKADNDRLTEENKEANKVIERVMRLPLRPRAVGHVTDLDRRLPSFLAPEVRKFLQNTAGDDE